MKSFKRLKKGSTLYFFLVPDPIPKVIDLGQYFKITVKSNNPKTYTIKTASRFLPVINFPAGYDGSSIIIDFKGYCNHNNLIMTNGEAPGLLFLSTTVKDLWDTIKQHLS